MTDLEGLKNTISGRKGKKIKTMADLLDEHDFNIEKIGVGDIVEGTILEVIGNEVWIDISRRCIGVVRGSELYDTSGKKADFSKGDKVLASVSQLEDSDGYMVLSFKKASREKIWRDLKQKLENQEVISVKICEANKGGLLTQIGEVQGFLPTSQLSAENYPKVEGGNKDEILFRLKKFVGENIKVKVIDIDRSANKLILSEKEANVEKRKEIVSSFKVGQIILGKVTGIVDFGVFVDLGEIEGLVHISEVSWDKVENLGSHVQLGKKIKVKIIGVEDDKVSLSIKRLIPDPWVKAVSKYKPGQVVEGRVIRLTPFGAFVNIDDVIDGLVHISEIAEEHILNPSDVLNIGDELQFKILSIEPKSHKLELSLKTLKKPKGVKKKKEISKIEDIQGITPSVLQKLKKAGFSDIKSLSCASEEDVIKIPGIGVKTAKNILGKIPAKGWSALRRQSFGASATSGGKK